MKKIGIMTFHTALNYGAVMQTYALQNYLKSIDMENEVINYISPYIEKCYKPFFVADGKILNSLIRGVLFSRNIRKKNRNFKKFIKEKLVTSDKKIYKNEELKSIVDDYEYFITGSDQVWSPVSAGFDIAYFLNFAKDNQKFSYAASIGTTDINEEKMREYKKRLNGFSLVSVREKSAKNIIDKIDDNFQTDIHVDPTLLLTKSQWSQLVEPINMREKYLLIFNVEKSINNVGFAKKIAKERNLKIVYINDRTLIKDKGIEYIQAPAPEMFLSLFANAEAIVTNSFHGTVFSIIFEKDFYVELENKKHKNIRSEGLLNMVQIKNRVINDTYKTDEFDSVDWDNVKKHLNIERKRSFHYFAKIKEVHNI